MSKQYRIEIGMGTGFDQRGAAMPIEWLLNALRQIEERAIEIFGGFTWIGTEGGWRNDNAEVVKELGRTLLIFAPGNLFESPTNKAKDLAQFAAQKLNQQCVALSISEVDFNFISQ